MDKKDAAKVIQFLEDVRKRVSLYVGTDVLAIIPWLNGFDMTCGLLGMESWHSSREGHSAYEQVVIERGYEWTPFGALPSMQERGFSEEQIADELIKLEIEAIKQKYSL